jgi:hypothetical protein
MTNDSSFVCLDIPLACATFVQLLVLVLCRIHNGMRRKEQSASSLFVRGMARDDGKFFVDD